ncbi:amino acid permease [Cellulosimicrobium sp. NPDC055967]|uniref:amino acid permease n=1 Tax=Cellulosimicrobium sp. NPDC055967 TaxID=3345670 RepID=UPI0035D77A33
MRALTWQGREKVGVEDVPDPRIEEPTDAVVRVTSTAICGSDLHLYGVLGMLLDAGDVLGHEAMGVVEEVGPEAGSLQVGDRVVVPFNIACGRCWMCERGLQTQCETTQVRSQDKGAALFGYTRLYGQVPGGQAQYLRVPQAQYGPVVVPDDGTPDERYLYLSDVVPTAWQAVEYADVPPGGTVVVLGLGPIGQMSARIALHRGAARVVGVDLVPERRAMAERHGVETLDPTAVGVAAVAVVDPQTLAGSTGPLLEVVEAEGSVPAWVFSLVALIAVANGALLTMIMSSRLAYGMAEQGLLPPVLGRVLPRRRTPWVAIVVTTVVAMGLVFTGDVAGLAETVVLLLLLVFASTNVAVLVLRRDPVDAPHFRVTTVVPVLSVASCVLLLTQQDAVTWLRAGILLAVGAVLYGVMRWTGRTRAARPAREE